MPIKLFKSYHCKYYLLLIVIYALNIYKQEETNWTSVLDSYALKDFKTFFAF